MPVIKINLPEIAEKLRNEVLAIDASDMPQAKKTAAHKRAAQKVLNALYLDGRKYSGKNLENRISLNTFSSYLTKLRKMMGELGLRHHLLGREVARMQARYPHHAALLAPLADEQATPDQLRIAKKTLQQALTKESELAVKLARVDFAGKYKAALLQLAKGHPEQAEAIKALVDEAGRPARLLALQAGFAELQPLQDDLAALKIDHEVVVALKMPANLKEQKLQTQDAALHRRQRDVYQVNYPAYMQALGHMLTQSWATVDGVTDWDFDLLVFGLCGATGRRPIEIILLGNLEKIDGDRLLFSGAAKKRIESRESHAIYSLLPADTVLTAFKALREHDYTKGIADLVPLGDYDLRSLEAMINARVANNLNQLAKCVFAQRPGARFYDTRAIYGRICLTRYFNTDPRWERMNEDAFFSEILAHDTADAQLHYKMVELVGYEEAQAVPERVASRLERLRKLDPQVPGLSRGTAAQDLHDWVKAQVAASPAKVINQSVIMREYGKPHRPMVQRYLELVADALMLQPTVRTDSALPLKYPFLPQQQDADEQVGQVAPADDQEQEDDDSEAVPAGQSAPGDELEPAAGGEAAGQSAQDEPAELTHDAEIEALRATLPRPRFRCKTQGDEWLVIMTLGRAIHETTLPAGSMVEACKLAWDAWLASWGKMTIQTAKQGKFVTARATCPDGMILEVAAMGRTEDAEQALLRSIAKRQAAYEGME